MNLQLTMQEIFILLYKILQYKYNGIKSKIIDDLFNTPTQSLEKRIAWSAALLK